MADDAPKELVGEELAHFVAKMAVEQMNLACARRAMDAAARQGYDVRPSDGGKAWIATTPEGALGTGATEAEALWVAHAELVKTLRFHAELGHDAGRMLFANNG